jgi:hypothetical protein
MRNDPYISRRRRMAHTAFYAVISGAVGFSIGFYYAAAVAAEHVRELLK